MKFTRYSSIENSYRELFMNKIVQEGKVGGEWIVTEKIHGANFSIWFDIENSEIKYAKRSGFLSNENFYNHYLLKENLERELLYFFEHLKKDEKAKESIVLQGELFGGSFITGHNNPKVKAVQKGVFYSPNLEFMAYDMKFDGVLQSFNELSNILDWFDHLVTTKIRYIKPLFKGSFEECLKFDINFNSTIPKILGFDEIENNICEGIVIKPVEPSFLACGARIIIKNKNEKFKEKGTKERKEKNNLPTFSEKEKGIFSELLSYVTENRLKNVISKIGEIGQKDFGKLLGLVAKDTLEDFLKDNEEKFDSLDKKIKSLMNKGLNKDTATLIRKHFLNIVDGTF